MIWWHDEKYTHLFISSTMFLIPHPPKKWPGDKWTAPYFACIISLPRPIAYLAYQLSMEAERHYTSFFDEFWLWSSERAYLALGKQHLPAQLVLHHLAHRWKSDRIWLGLWDHFHQLINRLGRSLVANPVPLRPSSRVSATIINWGIDLSYV